MVPGGVTELVWHFAGYLQIINDIARDRIDYDEAAFRNLQDDYVAKLPDYGANPNDDELDSHGLRGPDIAPVEDIQATRVHPIKALSDQLPEPDLDLDPSGFLPRFFPAAFASGGGAGGFIQHITVHYSSGGEQTLLQIRQGNIMSDDDSLLVLSNGRDMACDSALIAAQAELLTVHTEAVLQHMADDANEQIPKEWWIPQNGSGVTDFVFAHDEDMSARNGAPDVHSVGSGYYLNGVLQDPATTPPDQTPAPEPEAAPDYGHGLGQWALAGGNTSFNAALIVDMTESGRSMIVMGDYYKTNTIFQTNSTMDHDRIDAPGSDPSLLVTGGDKADNIADFVRHPGVYDGLPVTFAGPQWHVDVVEGNYYDVHTIVQMNYLSDNDIVVQKSGDTHYEVYSGENELGNLAEVFDGTVHYDLIIVAGAYHGMNVIFQNNILLNNDEIKLLTDGLNASQSVVSGQNSLTNAATIENYGDDNFQPMNDHLSDLVSAVGDGTTTLDPAYGKYIDGSGGVFDVLYVKGDYYDINAIWQTNVTSDVNVMIQLLNAPSAGALAFHPDGTETQSVTTGKDSLSNDAAIVDVGATNTYVNGEVYGDTILVQANLLPADKDHLLTHDTQTLVPELVAFVNESQEEAPAAQPVALTPAHEDPIASVMH